MQELKKIRQYLHAYPELSGSEAKASQIIADSLNDLGIRKIYQNISHHSLVAQIDGRDRGPVILFRCELDALPIEETSDAGYRSKNPGISHACGHDGHMAIMLGFLQQMAKNPPEKGKILFLFQSAEETGQGAKEVLNSGFLDNHSLEYAFSLHNLPGYNLGDIICRAGNFTPSVESITIDLVGKTSHAGEPDHGINPATTIAEVITFLKSLQEMDSQCPDYFVVTPVQIKMGEEAFGTSAGNAKIRYTFRSWGMEKLDRMKRKIEKGLNEIVRRERGLTMHSAWSEPFKANRNHPDAVSIIRKAAAASQLTFIERKEPLTWGEDFGLFTERYKGAMFGMGAGKEWTALHNPDYNFPDDLIEPGVRMFVSIVEEILG